LRMEAELEGRLGQYQAAISEAQQQIGEAELQLVANQTARDDQVATQLDQVQAELNAIEEKLLASKDVLNRTVVAAPVNGIIVNLKFKTESGVIQPGVPIMDIVPAEDRLLIDARISPMDIDVVRAGLKAQVQLSAISARSAPRIEGFVRSVSADRIVDEKTMQAFFLARIEVSREELDRVGTRIELVPGMPADVLIVTGERTMANYLLRSSMRSGGPCAKPDRLRDDEGVTSDSGVGRVAARKNTRAAVRDSTATGRKDRVPAAHNKVREHPGNEAAPVPRIWASCRTHAAGRHRPRMRLAACPGRARRAGRR
jgi:hypothetical protein